MFIFQLPIYGEDVQKTPYKFQPEEPLPLQREFATVRTAFNEEYERVAVNFYIILFIIMYLL